MDFIEWAAHFPTERGSWAEFVKDVTIGIIAGHLRCMSMIYKFAKHQVLRRGLKSLGVVDEIYPTIQNGKIDYAFVGYGRTGTFSVYLALKQLGFKGVHSEEWGDQPEVLDYFHEHMVKPSIDVGKVIVGDPDMRVIANYGYTAVFDIVPAIYYEQMLNQFPDCKFILTSRDSESWFESWTSMTQIVSTPLHLAGKLFRLPALTKGSDYIRWLFAYLNQDASILTAPWPTDVTNRETAIPMYEAHNKRVREIIPPEKLLEYHPREGWAPLCKFMELDPCPTTPFPHSNSRLSMRVQAWSAFLLLLEGALVLFFGVSLIRKVLGPKKTKAKAKSL